MATASTASLSFAFPRRKRGSFHDRYFKVLLLALAGYAFTGKGFAYAGIPPIFPGEVLLLLGLVSLFFPAPSWAIFSKAPNVLLASLMIWTVIRTVPYIGQFGADALRDSIIVMYGIFAFIVANLVLEPDIDEIAAFDHLLGRLRKARLVAVDRRNVEETGQKKHDAAQQQKQDGAEVAGGGEIERERQPAAGMRRFHRLLACSKTPDMRGFNHPFRIR